MKVLEIPGESHLDSVNIFHGEYDLPLKESPKTVLDLGANHGLFSAWAAQQWPEAQITAYEPWPENAAGFRKNLLGENRVTLIQKAVRGFSGQSDMFACDNLMECSFHFRRGQSAPVECVDARSLPSADFVKLDVEGSEWEILSRIPLAQTKAVAMEVHDQKDIGKLQSWMVSWGFCVYEKRPSVNGCWLMKFARREALAVREKLMLAIPYYGGVHPSFIECLCRLLANPPCHLAVKHCNGDSLVSRARNTLTAEFLESDCTDILFLDSDLVFSAQQVQRIMAFSEPVVGGFYPKKQEGEVCWVCNGCLTPTEIQADGLQEVRYMGTGFLRIKRHVFEKMIERWGDEIAYAPDHSENKTEHDLWPVGVYRYPDGTRRYLSEDWYFCQRWLDLGGKVYGDTRIILKHIGTAVFPLKDQVQQIMTPLVTTGKDTA